MRTVRLVIGAKTVDARKTQVGYQSGRSCLLTSQYSLGSHTGRLLHEERKRCK